ncbi:hypothetical protein GCM10017712_35110 [Curtobacterium citreum]
MSVVLVNYKGTDDTLTSIVGLTEQDWPADKLEIVVVDNDSGPEHVGRLKASDLPFTLVESGGNLGFTGGCNLGVANTTGEYVAFLNNDARPDPGWIREAMATFASGRDIGAVASKVLDWEGVNVDFTEAAMTWYGMGYKPFAGSPEPVGGRPRRTSCSGRAPRCSSARTCSSSSTASTTATSCSTRTWTSVGASTCSAGASGTSRSRSRSTSTTPR